MKDRLPMFKARDIVQVLRKLGFYKVRQKGAQMCFKHSHGSFTLIPSHGGEDIGRGLLRQILKEIKLNPDEFIRYLLK